MLHDLKVFQKTYDFLFWVKQIVPKFAKVHKYSLGLELETEVLRLLRCIIRANMARDKKVHIEQCLVVYETVRVLVRLCKDFKLISVKQYEFASERLVEIGKMLGGWRRRYGG